MSRWKNVCAVLCIFILGTVFGLAIALWMVPQSRVYDLTAREILARRISARLADQLNLNPAQEQAISSTIEETRMQLLEIRKETRPRIHRTLKEARTKIRAQLNAAQQAKFDEMIRKNQLRFFPSVESGSPW